MERPATRLDSFVTDFVKVLDACNVKYALVSGYVAILFGRSRNSEDIDIIIKKLDYARWQELYNVATESFELITAADAKDAFENYLSCETAIRLARKGSIIPNIELKFPKTRIENWVVDKPVKAELNGNRLAISPLELQIAYKLFLGSDKDFEDARHLWLVCKDNLDKQTLNGFIAEMKVAKTAARWLA